MYLITVSFLIAFLPAFRTQALECGIGKREHQREVQRIMQICLYNTVGNGNQNVGHSASAGRDYEVGDSDSSDSSESESAEADSGVQSNDTNRNAYMRLSSTIAPENGNTSSTTPQNRQSNQDAFNNSTRQLNQQSGSNANNTRQETAQNLQSLQNGTNNNNGGNNGESSGISDTTSQNREANATDGCVVRCFLNHMHVMNVDGYPDQQRVVHGLLKEANGREVRDFLEDSTNECFQQLEGHNLDSCEFSTQLVMCLADRGRANCADWPAGSLPFQQ